MISLLVVEDDIGIQNQLKWSLSEYQIFFATDFSSAIESVKAHKPEVILLDLGLPPDPGGASEGLRTLSEALTILPRIKVIIITGSEDRRHALEAINLGAYDFYHKPISPEDLRLVVNRALKVSELEGEVLQLQKTIGRSTLDGVIATSETMTKICREIEKLAPSDLSTLLLGESGTGKELLARALHDLSSRAGGPLVSINCAAIPENLLESELFGYEKGAFTGAVKQTKGKLEYANGGTLFLDEIGDLPPPLQAKLLRFLQEKTIERIGGRTEIHVDVRVVSATHQNLKLLIEKNLFREDLYYRLGEVTVSVPALRERETDSLVLARHFLSKYSADTGREIKKFSGHALKAISTHAWPGNIRELENRVKRASVMADGKIIQCSDLDLDAPVGSDTVKSLKQIREDSDRDAITKALHFSGWNITKAAQALGITRPTIYDLMDKLGINSQLKEDGN